MGSETMDLDQLASYLRRDSRELQKLATRGQLPGRKVGGAWRFARAEINQWLGAAMRGFDDEQLKRVFDQFKALADRRRDGLHRSRRSTARRRWTESRSCTRAGRWPRRSASTSSRSGGRRAACRSAGRKGL